MRGQYTVQSGGGGEGLTPGFWKNHSIYGNAPLSKEEWTAAGYNPDQSYEAVFGIVKLGANPTGTDALPTLYDALNAGGGGVNALLRHSTAALLNAADPNVDYLYSVAQIISMTQTAINSGDAALIEATKNLFETQNELGADLSTPAGGSTTTTTDDFDADTSGSGPIIPVGGTATFTYFVINTGDTPLSNVTLTDVPVPGGGAPTLLSVGTHFSFHGIDYVVGSSAGGGNYYGDVNVAGNTIGALDLNEIWVYTASETVQTTNEHLNIATVTGTDTSTGNTATDHDAAYYNTPGLFQSLGDYVWLDANNNGIQDATEAGIDGVLVHLQGAGTDGIFNTGDDTFATQTTAAGGHYEFDNLATGKYIVKFDAPAGLVFSTPNVGVNDAIDSDADATGNTGTYTLTPGQQNLTVDAGLYQTAHLGDRLWVDTNGNGLQDDGATGIVGATVTLIGGGADGLINGIGDTTTTTTTGVNGFYDFAGLTPGVQYQVMFTAPAGYVFTTQDVGANGFDTTDSDANTGTGKTQIVTLSSGQYNSTLDAGLKATLGSIGNFVFCDDNRNGIQDAGEDGVAGITVKLIGGGADGLVNGVGDVIVGTTTTNASGLYSFTGLAAGQYQVQFTAPTGYTFSTKDVGSDTTDSDADLVTGKSQVITLAAGQNNTTIDAGLQGIHAVFDLTGSSSTDGTDGNIRTFTQSTMSVHVSAFSRDKAAGTWATAYLGSYGGGVGVTDSSEGSGGNNTHTVDNTGGRDNYVLFEFDRAIVLDKAFLGYVVGDSDLQVWIGNFTNAFNSHITLSDTVLAAMGFTQVDTTTLTTTRTADLNAGGYSGNVVVIAADTTDTSPEDFFKIGNVDVTSFPCDLVLAQIGDRVWYDVNGNGTQDAGEVGVAGATVKLIGAGADNAFGTGDDVTLATTTTDANGIYAFTGLTPGAYQVQFVAPSTYSFTAQNVGSDATDSDANISTGKSQVVSVAAGETNNTIDAGVWKPAALGDYVWCDTNGNGIQDAGESGVAGVTVKLIGGGADGLVNGVGDVTLATTTTNASGIYGFTGLAAGQYQVQFVAPSGNVFTTANVSSDTTDSDANTATGKSHVVTLVAGQTDNTIDAGLHHTTDFTPDVFDGTTGFWKNHQEAWNGSTADNSAVANLVSSGVLSKYDVLPTGVDSNGDGHVNSSDLGVLLGDMNANGKTDSGETTLFVSLTAAQYIIDPGATYSDTRLILMRQAIAAQLNIDNGHHEPNDVLSEAVKWLRGQAPFTYTDGTTGKIGNGDGVLQSSEYTISGGLFSFTAGALGSSSQAWTQDVDVYGGSNTFDWDNNTSLAGNQEANGQDVKNALQSFNMGQLVTSLDGSQVGLYNGSFVDFSHSNTTDSFWLTLHDGGLI